MIVIRFEPQPDITAFELTQLVNIHMNSSRYNTKGKELWDSAPDNVKRHVVVVSDDSDKKKMDLIDVVRKYWTW